VSWSSSSRVARFLGETEGHQLEAEHTEGAKESAELIGISGKLTMKSVPAGDLGFTE
jgi:hypothetical protein